MRISDWSSDVCSSDLRLLPFSVRDNRADSARLMQAAPFINIGLKHDPQHLLARPGGISRSDPGSLRRGGAIDPARRTTRGTRRGTCIAIRPFGGDHGKRTIIDGRTRSADAIGRGTGKVAANVPAERSEELPSLMRISYAVFCLKKKTNTHT